MNTQNISDELLNSFVDGELVRGEAEKIFSVIAQDETLKERVCELRGLKEMVLHAYHQPPATKMAPVKKPGTWRISCMQSMPRLATCMMMMLLGWGAGWMMFAGSQSTGDPKLAHLFEMSQRSGAIEKSGNLIVHVSNSNPVRLKTALDETEDMLKSYQLENRNVKVEIIANGDGMDLLRADVSPFGKRIALMKAKYPNLDFVACQQTISKLEKQGVIVKLLPHSGIAESAVEEIEKRLHQGWDYVRV